MFKLQLRISNFYLIFRTIKGQSKRQPNIGYHILISITLLLVLNIIPTIKSLHINLKMILSALMEQVQDTLVMEVGVLLKEVVQLIKSVLQQSLNFMMPKTPIIFGWLHWKKLINLTQSTTQQLTCLLSRMDNPTRIFFQNWCKIKSIYQNQINLNKY